MLAFTPWAHFLKAKPQDDRMPNTTHRILKPGQPPTQQAQGNTPRPYPRTKPRPPTPLETAASPEQPDGEELVVGQLAAL